jgi:hypothetical protein
MPRVAPTMNLKKQLYRSSEVKILTASRKVTHGTVNFSKMLMDSRAKVATNTQLYLLLRLSH